ncbi:MAG: HAD family hydrolase [Erysipelotrichaceae bacterium]|nr:HAD family hydrolase [Erysipelotrichaceae bacterium]
MIRLFASDLDDTLLNIEHATDSYILDTIKAVKDEGKVFTCATGRSLHEHEISRLHIDDNYTISMNGAMIRNPEGKVIYSKPIDKNVIKECLTLFNGCDFDYSGDEHTYSTTTLEEKIEGFHRDGFKELPGNPVRIRDFFMDFIFKCPDEEILKHDIYKINANLRDPDTHQRFVEFLESHKGSLVNAPTYDPYFEVTQNNVNKGVAVAFLADYLNIPEDEVMVFGDGGNDYEMLSMFKNSYSPENASDEAKQRAHYVIGKSSDYSVSKEIRKNLEKAEI